MIRALLILLLLLTALHAQPSQAAEANTAMRAHIGGDLAVTADTPRIVAVGGNLTITDAHADLVLGVIGAAHVVNADINRLIVTGGDVDLQVSHLGQAIIAGGDITLNSKVARDFIVMGGTVIMTKDSSVGGKVVIAGSDVTLDGAITGDLDIHAEKITVAGTIGGKAHLAGKDIVLTPGTRIAGDLLYSGVETLDVPADVTVGGKVIRGGEEAQRGGSRFWSLRSVFLRALGFASLALAGALIAMLTPTLVTAANARITGALPQSIGIGLALAVAAPLLATLLGLTIVGLLLATLVLAAAGLIFALGAVVVSAQLGDAIRRRSRQPEPTERAGKIGWVIGGAFAIMIVGIIPVLGPIAQSLTVFAGSGAILTTLWRNRSAPAI